MLKFLHSECWRKYKDYKSKEGFALPPGEEEQKPGHLPAALIENLRGQIAALPPRKKYTRTT